VTVITFEWVLFTRVIDAVNQQVNNIRTLIGFFIFGCLLFINLVTRFAAFECVKMGHLSRLKLGDLSTEEGRFKLGSVFQDN